MKFQESGGGWGNPLLGREFDSQRDLSPEKLPELAALVKDCDFAAPAKLKQRAIDAPAFELNVRLGRKQIRLVADRLGIDAMLRRLVDFVSNHARKTRLK